jgi:hypothetical protein
VGESLGRLLWADNGEAGAGGQPQRRAFPKGFVEGFADGFIEAFSGVTGYLEFRSAAAANQLFNNDLIRLSNSSNEVSPLIFSPLRKKVGVEFT